MLYDRYNFTNADDPYFMLDMLELINARLIEENDSALIVIYAVNQKGRSVGVVIRELELGGSAKLDRGNDESALVNLSTFLVLERFYCCYLSTLF